MAPNPEDLERLPMGHSPKMQSILEAARRRFRAGRGIPHDEFWKRVEAESAGRVRKQSSTPRNVRRGNEGRP